MPHLYILWDHLLQPSASWKKAPQQIEPSSSFLFSEHPSLVQKPLTVLLDQKFQADPEYSHPVPVVAQKLHGVHDVHRDVLHDAQIYQSACDLISQISTCVSWMKRLSG